MIIKFKDNPEGKNQEGFKKTKGCACKIKLSFVPKPDNRDKDLWGCECFVDGQFTDLTIWADKIYNEATKDVIGDLVYFKTGDVGVQLTLWDCHY